MLDLIKAHEGNVESSDDHPNKIHWGKYNMIGKFVASTTQCQIQCKNAPEYNNIPDRPHIRRLLDQSVMDGEVRSFSLKFWQVSLKLHRCNGPVLRLHPKNLSRKLTEFICLERILVITKAPTNLGRPQT